MANDRLRGAMAAAGVDAHAVAESAAVDPKTVQRWLGGRVPHPRHRMALVRLLGEEEDYLWPSARPDVGPGAEATAELVAAYGHRVDVPRQKWTSLLSTARRHIDLLGYAFLFLPEQHVELTSAIELKCRDGCQVRIMVANPDGRHVLERDDLERLGGNLPARIRTTLHHLEPIHGLAGVEIRFHDVHLYNAIYRFDDEMIVTPYLYRAHGYQHPALHLRRLSAYGVFAGFADHYDMIWSEAGAATAPAPMVAEGA
jgi:hypothetical protein